MNSATSCQVIRFGKTKKVRRTNETPMEALLKRYLAGAQAGRFTKLTVVVITDDNQVIDETAVAVA